MIDWRVLPAWSARLSTPAPFHLRTLGGLAALQPDGRPAEGAGGQKRRLALLALLDSAGERGLSRDKLLGYLWPESESDKARNALAQALYALRKGLGHDDLFVGTNEIRLNPERLASDRAAFLADLARGDREAAVGRYAGPFLDGFYLAEAPEFERWVETERASLAHEYVAAVQHLAAKAEASRDAATAVRWWRKLVAIDPLNGALTLGLMRALADAGDRIGALRQAQVYQALVEEEFGGPGDPAVAAVVEELRRPPAGAPPVPPTRGLAAQLSTAEVVATALKRLRTSRSLALSRESDTPGAPQASPQRRRLSAVQERLGAGGYRVEREVGAGGMATVYLARDLRHDRPVAIKILHEGLGASVGAERFLAEIRTTARLQHPHILPLLDSRSIGAPGEPDELLFYVMPFVEGESLRDRLTREKQLPIDEVIRLTGEIADALGYAHAHGIVHRDIKPENILLQGGHAVVTDFGIALAVQAAGGARLTRAGVSLGTPEYMAPEQASASADIDQRADIYALGVVAYEMLTGDPPFTGSTLQAVVAKMLNERPVAPRTVRDTIPEGVEAAVLTALAKLPADRFPEAQDFARALVEAATPSSGARPAPQLRRPGRTLALLGTGAAVLALSLLAFALLRPGARPLVMGAITPVTHSIDTLNFDAAISPDGRFVAYAAGPAGEMRLLLRQVSGSAPVPIVTGLSGDHRWPRWSPDGSRLAFVADRAIYLIPVLGGVPQRVVSLGDLGGQPAWSPDGSQLVYADSGGISSVAISGGAPHRVARMLEAHSPSWSPDGRRIAFAVENLVFVNSAGYGNAAPSAIWTASATGGDSALVTDAQYLNTAPVWWPDGRGILFVSDRDGPRDVYRQRVSSSGRPRGAPERVTSGLDPFTFTLTPDGSQMAYSTLRLRSNIWMAPIAADGVTPSSAARAVTTERQSIEGIAVSHDGKWLAFDSNRNGNLDIYKVPFDGTGLAGAPVALTTDSAPDYEPRWSPGDSELVFYSRRFGTKDLFLVNADGRNERRLTTLPGNEYYPDWEPSGDQIVFSSQVSYAWDVLVTTRGPNATWTEPRRIDAAATPTVDVRWAPDGRTIALVDNARLGLQPIDGGPFRPLIDGRSLRESITFVVWGRDASRLYFQTRDPGGIYSYWSVSTAGGPPRRLLRLAEPGRRTRRPEFDTDGRNLFFTVVDDEADVAVVSLRQQ